MEYIFPVELRKISAAVTALLFVYRFVVAVAVGSDIRTRIRGGAAATATSVEPNQEAAHGTNEFRRHRSLVIGTPTGGGKYPFLVVVNWLDSVPDPRSSESIRCHGTMIAPDIVLVPNLCLPDKGYVMVGDSSNSSFMQFRNVTSNAPNHVVHPGRNHLLFQIEPVTFSDFFTATVNRDPGGVSIGQELTVVGYGLSNVTSWPYSFPGEAYEAQVKVSNVSEGTFRYFGQEIGSCQGDDGAPLLDSSHSLVGITFWPGCAFKTEIALGISHVADWIERSACALSARKEAIPFCPDLVCPLDARLLGYPWALLPNGTGSVVGIRGFDPVRATQWPPPGTPLWRGTTTNVTISAFDAAGRGVECVWVVRVAPIVLLGDLSIDLPNGTYVTTRRFSSVTSAKSGRVYKMSGRTSDRLRGSGSRATAALRKGSTRFNGKKLTLKQNQTKGSVIVPSVPLQFNNLLSDVELSLEVVQNARQNRAAYKAYGQLGGLKLARWQVVKVESSPTATKDQGHADRQDQQHTWYNCTSPGCAHD